MFVSEKNAYLIRNTDQHFHIHRYKIDSSFVHLPAPEILILIGTSLTKLKSELDLLELEKLECEEGMIELKEVLYAKFGSKFFFF